VADYYALIASAVSKLDRNTGEARQALYRRARLTLVDQLRNRIHDLLTEGGERSPPARQAQTYDDLRRATRLATETFKLNLAECAEKTLVAEGPGALDDVIRYRGLLAPVRHDILIELRDLEDAIRQVECEASAGRASEAKKEFVAFTSKFVPDVTVDTPDLANFDACAAAALSARAIMPGIGFLSANKKLACFVAVCAHIDDLVGAGHISIYDTELVILILRGKDRKFSAAVEWFEYVAPNLRAEMLADMPQSAQDFKAVIIRGR
jgi:hypothetical protein